MPFCRSMSFLITTFKIHHARGPVSQQTETKRSQPISARVEDTRYLEIPGHCAWGDSLTTRKTHFNFWKGFFPYWILSLMQLVRYLPCSGARNRRPGHRGVLVPKPKAWHARMSILGDRSPDQAPETQPQARIHF